MKYRNGFWYRPTSSARASLSPIWQRSNNTCSISLAALFMRYPRPNTDAPRVNKFNRLQIRPVRVTGSNLLPDKLQNQPLSQPE
jgi:hypothetical protein